MPVMVAAVLYEYVSVVAKVLPNTIVGVLPLIVTGSGMYPLTLVVVV
jgi:hypothetical protein